MTQPAPLTARSLAALPGIAHGFFTRRGGVSSGLYASLNCGLGSEDDREKVLENRRRVASHLGAAAVVTLYQTHSATALVVDRPPPLDALPKADAVVTATPGLAVGALAADCAPVLFADAEARVVAAAHAGWRGAVGGVLEAAIAAMEGLGAERCRIRAAIGPCIRQRSYEVGPEFEAQVNGLDAANARFFARPWPEARARFDLPGYVAARLSSAGLTAVETTPSCTYEAESLFSYRRSQHRGEPDYGRQISAIVVA
jgi:YfiH family protein